MTLSCGQWFEGLVRFVYIGGIVDHYYLNVHFIMHVLISSLYVCVLLLYLDMSYTRQIEQIS